MADRYVRLLLHKDGTRVKVGDKVTSREEEFTITGWPNTGWNRVWANDAQGRSVEYFPSVFDLHWGD